MPRKKKSKLQKKKDNPRSGYWKTKADELWGKVLHLTEDCLVSDNCAGGLEAHHLIGRANTATRHKVENGVILCSKHHKFCNKLSAHGAPLAFAEFLQEFYPEKWKWCCENKHKIEKPDYKQAYEGLKQILEDINGE